ncbi:MAG TPA: MTAP family purine nucleoside phosphorylase [Opitutaceae bacterium]|jgi:5'-methylthioadenosine phosphorylase|nr:MTAP family purine nucleoside phosphorylase [Opitutaceae bacterium]
MKVAFISGTSIAKSDVFAAWTVRTVETHCGAVTCRARGDFVLLNRHGHGSLLPPHRINHHANIRALADLGFTDVVALNSVGSLKPELPPGTLVSCSDYVCLQSGPQTFFDDELKGGAPGIDSNLIPLLEAKLAPEFEVKTGKIYVQTQGPRFETKAEVQIIKNWGDVVGMTAAHEADLCREAGLRYNLLAMVDNYANGLEGTAIDFEKFRELVQANQRKVDRLFTRLLEILA